MDLNPLATADSLDLGKLSPWAPELARTFVALASDIALLIDDSGVIRTVEQGEAQPVVPTANAWVGRSWIDTVSPETRSKIEKLLKEASSEGIARRREVSHPLHAGASLPMAYTAIRLGEHGPVLAVGRDMRSVAAIQERFIESQQDMERGYWNSRQAESRYRLLCQVATDAVMVIDAESLLIVDVNPAAAGLFASAGEPLIGKPATVGFAHPSRAAVAELLATARSSGQSGEIRARLLGTLSSISVAATSFRADDTMRLLVRVRTLDDSAVPVPRDGAREDAAVVTDSSGRIQLASSSFLALVHLAREADAKGRSVLDFLGAFERPLDELISQVRRQGVVRSFVATARSGGARAEPVDVSAALLTEGDQECIGFTIRRVQESAPASAALPPSLTIDVQRLVGRVGELPLASLLREAAALAEKHFVELALERSGGNADAAASLLGIARGRLDAVASATRGAPVVSDDSS